MHPGHYASIGKFSIALVIAHTIYHAPAFICCRGHHVPSRTHAESVYSPPISSLGRKAVFGSFHPRKAFLSPLCQVDKLLLVLDAVAYSKILSIEAHSPAY